MSCAVGAAKRCSVAGSFQTPQCSTRWSVRLRWSGSRCLTRQAEILKPVFSEMSRPEFRSVAGHRSEALVLPLVRTVDAARIRRNSEYIFKTHGAVCRSTTKDKSHDHDKRLTSNSDSAPDGSGSRRRAESLRTHAVDADTLGRAAIGACWPVRAVRTERPRKLD